MPAYCAEDGENCDCNGDIIVYAQKWKDGEQYPMMMDEAQYYDFTVNEMNNTGTQKCAASTFEGVDPLPGLEKACHCVKEGYVDSSYIQ